jgi:hypothetical protein
MFLSYQSHAGVGRAGYPLWILFLMNGAVAFGGGVLLTALPEPLTTGFDLDDVDPTEFQVVPRSEWLTLQTELDALRSLRGRAEPISALFGRARVPAAAAAPAASLVATSEPPMVAPAPAVTSTIDLAGLRSIAESLIAARRILSMEEMEDYVANFEPEMERIGIELGVPRYQGEGLLPYCQRIIDTVPARESVAGEPSAVTAPTGPPPPLETLVRDLETEARALQKAAPPRAGHKRPGAPWSEDRDPLVAALERSWREPPAPAGRSPPGPATEIDRILAEIEKSASPEKSAIDELEELLDKAQASDSTDAKKPRPRPDD